jgi:DMSO/TMAO reductase YedYZ molybdopterin-dependent catalytic subunit
MTAELPNGQRDIGSFPRFGLGRFANRFPTDLARRSIRIGGDVTAPLVLADPFAGLERVEQVSDFNCVTTWSARSLRWGGVRFADVHAQLIEPHIARAVDATLVVFRGEDGFAAILPLADALADDVLLADRLNGEPLGIDHGAPLRLVAPAHYGFKNVKHLTAIEYWRDRRHYHFPRPYPGFMDHPRGRVALEERGLFFPAWLLRIVYRLLIPSTIRNFRNALVRHETGGSVRPRDKT